jgi:hypothetical protein
MQIISSGSLFTEEEDGKENIYWQHKEGRDVK